MKLQYLPGSIAGFRDANSHARIVWETLYQDRVFSRSLPWVTPHPLLVVRNFELMTHVIRTRS